MRRSLSLSTWLFVSRTTLVIICFFANNSFSQTSTIDSLKKLLPSLTFKARIDCLNELGFEFSNRYWSKSKYQQTDSAYIYTFQALNESQQQHYLNGVGKAFQNLSMIYEEHGDFGSSYYFTKKALPVLQKANMQTEFHRCCVNLGWCLYHRGYFQKSSEVYTNEASYYAGVQDSKHLAMIYRMTARAFDMLGNSEKAFEYFQKDFRIRKKPKDVFGNMVTPTTRAFFYLIAGDTNSAIFYFKQSTLSAKYQHVILEAYHQNRAMIFRFLCFS